MNIKIEGDPGTGNTFMEINIQHVENFYPASYMPTNNNGSRARHQDIPQQSIGLVDESSLRSEILTYVNCLRPFLADKWKGNYQQMWESILDTDVVSEVVYHTGKQQGTNFNRNLIANIIYYLSVKGVYGDNYNASRFAERLEGDKDHSVRGALGKVPSDEVVSCLNHCFE